MKNFYYSFNPDGDAIGSSLALHHYLKSLNLVSNVIVTNRHPSFLDWVPGINDIIIYDEDIEKSNQKLTDSDLIFTMDLIVWTDVVIYQVL